MRTPSRFSSCSTHMATQRAILFVTHNQAHAKSIAQTIAMMAAARLHGVMPCAEFFGESANSVVREYARTGGSRVPYPDAPVEHMESGFTLRCQPRYRFQAVSQRSYRHHLRRSFCGSRINRCCRCGTSGLAVGERCRLSQVNLDLGAGGLYRLVYPDGTIRRLPHGFLTTGMQGKVSTTGQYLLQGNPVDEDHHAATIELGVKLLMGSVREYLLSGNSERMSLVSMDDKHNWIHEHFWKRSTHWIWRNTSVVKC